MLTKQKKLSLFPEVLTLVSIRPILSRCLAQSPLIRLLSCTSFILFSILFESWCIEWYRSRRTRQIHNTCLAPYCLTCPPDFVPLFFRLQLFFLRNFFPHFLLVNSFNLVVQNELTVASLCCYIFCFLGPKLLRKACVCPFRHGSSLLGRSSFFGCCFLLLYLVMDSLHHVLP